MSDDLKAPERIWIDDERAEGGQCHVYNEASEGVIQWAVGYVRADRIEALEREVAACARVSNRNAEHAEAAEAALAAMTAERDAKDHAFKVAVDRALQNGGLANATQARLAKAVEAVSNGLDQIDGMAAKHNPNSIWEMSRAIRATLAEIGGTDGR